VVYSGILYPDPRVRQGAEIKLLEFGAFFRPACVVVFPDVVYNAMRFIRTGEIRMASRYSQYFLMKDDDAAEYVKEKTQFFARDAELTVTEIGDGNLNYVFRVAEKATGKSLIVKQAGETLRISADMRVSTDRNRIESEILRLQAKYAPGSVPEIYAYDTVMCACIMEDLADYRLMRYALMDYETFPRFADDITTYMVNTLLDTSDVCMEHKAKKELVKRFINPELCEIT